MSIRLTLLLPLSLAATVHAASTQDTGSYRAYLERAQTSGATTALRFVDPADPTAASLVVDKGAISLDDSALASRFGGKYKAGAVSDLHADGLIYVNGGGLHDASLLKTATPVARRFAAESKACAIYSVFSDYANAADAGVFYSVRAADGSCPSSGASLGFARASAAAGDLPVRLGTGYRVLDAIYAQDSGAISGYLLVKSDTLFLAAADLSDLPGRILANLAAGTGRDVLATAVSGTSLVYLQATRSGDGAPHLFRLDTSSLALSSLHGYSGGAGSALLVDAANAYAADGGRVLAVAHTATSVSTLVSVSGVDSLRLDGLTADRVVFSTVDSSGKNSVRSALKAGSGSKTLKSASADALLNVWVAAANVYISSVNGSGVPGTVARAADGSGGSSTANLSLWLPGALSTSLPAGSDLRSAFQISRMCLFGLPPLSVITGDISTVKISLNTPSSGLSIRQIGTVKGVDASQQTYQFYGLGRYLFGSVAIQRSSGSVDTDTYFYDTQDSGSFRSLAHSSTKDELAVSH